MTGNTEDSINNKTMININGYELFQTCESCPEQYNVFKDYQKVGYMRLRHGYFSVEYPDCGGKKVYEAEPKGDGLFCDEERDLYLMAAINAIDKEHQTNKIEVRVMSLFLKIMVVIFIFITIPWAIHMYNMRGDPAWFLTIIGAR